MSFRDLYEYSQTVALKVRRNDLKDKVLQLSGVNQVAVMQSGFDTTQCRGMYLSLANADHPFIKLHGCRVIVLARGLEKPWQRFVFAKELMHMFDDPREAADSGDKFETLLTQLSGATIDYSPATRSEINCFWMALGVLCPEKQRINFRHSMARREVSEHEIALKVGIPENYVTKLLSSEYERNIARILNPKV